MRIGELSKRTGLSPSRIRFYESAGLLKVVHRQANGYRSYPPDAVSILVMIEKGEKAGFSLKELRALLPADLKAWDRTSLLDALREKLGAIEALEAQLGESKREVEAVLAMVEAKPEDMDCAEHAAIVLSRLGLGPDDGADS